MAGRSTALAFYVTLCIMAFIASKMVIAVLLYRRWMRKRRIIEEHLSGGKMVMFRSLTSKTCLKRTILKLTNKDIIGSGGYGTVYKLVIDSSTAFAVKRLSKGAAGAGDDKDRGFERELDTMGDIKHRNIVTLHGYYVTPQFNLLIYDLMPNGSLDCLLHGKAKETRKPLEWSARCRIAAGAARGLSYLHHDCIPHIIHRDIKSSNILLDHDMEARVSDFGLATLMGPNETHVSTVVAGTFGYLAPEYFDTGRATTKGDVYSFGVVLLELLTGKRPTDETFIEEGTRLVTWVKEVVSDKREEHALDSSLVYFPLEDVQTMFNIAEKCLETDPSKRPTMSEVLKQLEHLCQEKSCECMIDGSTQKISSKGPI